MFRSLGVTELIIILAIVMLLFGVGRVSKIGSELGTAISEFRKGLSEGASEKPDEADEADEAKEE